MWTGGTLLVLANGNLVDVFNDCPNSDGGGCGADTALRATSSTDGGEHWSDPIDMSPRGAVNHVTDAAVTPDGSSLYVAWFEGWMSAGKPHLARSLDGGRTFTESTSIPTTAVTNLNVAVSPDGTVGLLYYEPVDGSSLTDVWMARSIDHGDSFTKVHVAGPFDTSTLSRVGQGVGESQGFRSANWGFVGAITVATAGTPLDDNPTDVYFVPLR